MLGVRRRPKWFDHDAVLGARGETSAERRAACGRSVDAGLVEDIGDPADWRLLTFQAEHVEEASLALQGQCDVPAPRFQGAARR